MISCNRVIICSTPNREYPPLGGWIGAGIGIILVPSHNIFIRVIVWLSIITLVFLSEVLLRETLSPKHITHLSI